MSSSLPVKKPNEVRKFFDQYYTKKLEFTSNEVDAVITFFKKNGFEEASAISTGSSLLKQAKLDNVPVFQLLDTLKKLDRLQLSTVVAEVLNYDRISTSTIGFKSPTEVVTLEKRNILP